MNRNYKLIGIPMLILNLVSSSLGQQADTLYSTDLPSAVGTIFQNKYYKAEGNNSISVDLGSVGENQVWDLTTLEPNLPLTETWESIPVEGTPFGYAFPQANLVYKVTIDQNDTVTYNYVKITETELFELGQAKLAGKDTTLLVKLYKLERKTNFPVTWGVAPWIAVPEYESSVSLGPLKIDIIAHDSSYYEIDGWGILKTSLGTIPCLRVKQRHVIDVYTTAGTPFIRGYEKDVIYNWVAPTYGFVAEIKSKNQNTADNFTEAREVTIMTVFKPTSVKQLESANQIADFILFQNYPNPFNPITTIRYHLPIAANVKLKVFNTRGEEVATLVDKIESTGEHFVQWNAAAQPTGLYFYELQLDHVKWRKKCLLVK